MDALFPQTAPSGPGRKTIPRLLAMALLTGIIVASCGDIPQRGEQDGGIGVWGGDDSHGRMPSDPHHGSDSCSRGCAH